jgi:hypothetical protein
MHSRLAAAVRSHPAQTTNRSETGEKTMIRRIALMSVLNAALAAVIACSGQPSTQQDAPQPQPQPEAAAPAQEAQPVSTLSGTVVETMEAGPYTYVRVETTDGAEVWAAANRFEVAVGDKVVVPTDMPMEGFHSDTLNRDFDLIYFAGQIAHEGEMAPPEMPPGHPPVSGAAAAHGAQAPQAMVEPAPGGVTIAEIWAGKSRLADSTVTVRGQVVKFNGGILGTNWIHLQDGSGSPSAGNHDITVTTPAIAEVGDVVTATGQLVLDQDFGAGYSYPVLIKDAAVVKK